MEEVVLNGKVYKGILLSEDSTTKKVKLDAPWGVKIITIKS